MPGATNYRLIVDVDPQIDGITYAAEGLIPLTSHTIPRVSKLALGTYWWMMQVEVGGTWYDTPWRLLKIIP